MNELCSSVRPLLFQALEGQLDREQTIELNAHLAVCDACRSFERAERALTDLLYCEPVEAPLPLRRVGTWLAIAGSLVALLLILPAATPRGSIVERELAASTAWVETASELAETNQMRVPRNRSVTITLADDSTVEAVGPSRFDLVFEGESCRIAMLEGSARAVAKTPGSIVVTNRTGRIELAVGSYTIDLESVQPQDPQRQDPKPNAAALIAQGQQLFFQVAAALGGSADAEQANMAEAEKLFARALKDPDILPSQRNTALFYLSGAQGRQGKNEEALATGSRWLELFPNDPQRGYVLFFQAVRHERLGDLDLAKRIRRQVIEEAPDSEIAKHARIALGLVAPPAPIAKPGSGKAPRNEPVRAEVTPLTTNRGPYLVVHTALDTKRDAGFVAAARAATEFHRAEVAIWDGRDFAKLRAVLQKHAPENVVFVLRPDTLDINLHRQILLGSATIDADMFADFSFGYLTAKDDATVQELWKRIEALHREGLASKEWRRVSITSNDKSLFYENSAPQIAFSAGYRGSHSYVSIHDAEQRDFVDRTLDGLRDAAVIQFTGNGDPQGIWMFDDHRNIDRSKHWTYAKNKVGHDPEGEMPRILASEFAALDLASPILWSGTCHSGATCRVFVEGDIVSTFGRTDVTTVHELARDKSLALAWIDAGAAALLVPVAANHGMSVSMETDFALRHGASLGETIKSTYDDVFLAAGGELRLDIAKIGTPHGRDGYVMQGGGANRILIGDPALRPFEKVDYSPEQPKVVRTQSGFTVTLERGPGFTARSWDIYGDTRPEDWRIITRVDVTDLLPKDRKCQIEASLRATSPEGEEMAYGLRYCELEEHHGRRYLHLQANGTRAVVERKAVKAVFEVKVE